MTLAIGAISVLLLKTGVVPAGPCMTLPGGICVLAVIVCVPLGGLLVLIGLIKIAKSSN